MPTSHQNKQSHEKRPCITQWCRGRGCKRTTKTFDENPGEHGAQRLQKSISPFWEVTPKKSSSWCSWEKTCRLKSHKKRFGQVWGTSGKNPSPQIIVKVTTTWRKARKLYIPT